MTNKRVLTGLTAVIMTLSGMALPIVSYAQSDTAQTQDQGLETLYKQSGDYYYKVNSDGTATITRYIGNDENVVIPSELDGLTVTVIGSYQAAEDEDFPCDSVYVKEDRMCGAFEARNALKTVVIPDTVTKIEDLAFSNCANLESVIFGNSVREIDSMAFYADPALKSVTLPESVEVIGEKAFGYSALQDVPDSDFVIYCESDGAAEAYARENGIKFLYVGIDFPCLAGVIVSYSSTENAIRINWDKIEGVSGYVIYRFDESSKVWVKVKTIRDNSVTTYRQSGLKAGTTCKYRFRAFVKMNGGNIWSAYSDEFTAAAKPKAVAVNKISAPKTAVRLYWNRVSCTGYKIQQYDGSAGKWKTVKLVSGSKTNAAISGLTPGTKYKFRIQPYCKADGKNAYGAWSKTVTVTTKR